MLIFGPECEMGSIIGNHSNVHVSTSPLVFSGPDSSKKCSFISTADGTMKGADTQNCVASNGNKVF